MPRVSKHINKVLTHDDDREKEIQAFISGVFSKQEQSNSIAESIRFKIYHKLNRIRKELRFVDTNLLKFQKLTQREIEIIKLLATGNNNPNIAQLLYISRCTVEQHRKNINAKLGVKSFQELVLFIYAFDVI